MLGQWHMVYRLIDIPVTHLVTITKAGISSDISHPVLEKARMIGIRWTLPTPTVEKVNVIQTYSD
jgi:hypothetical protein